VGRQVGLRYGLCLTAPEVGATRARSRRSHLYFCAEWRTRHEKGTGRKGGVPHLSSRVSTQPPGWRSQGGQTRRERLEAQRPPIRHPPGLRMQAQGYPRVSPQGCHTLSPIGERSSFRAPSAARLDSRAARDGDGRDARLSFAGVAQLVEHLFCKQVVRGSSPLASSDTTHLSEGCPSGQREQAVNLPAYAFVGSNPTPSTSTGPGRTAGEVRDPVESVSAGVAQLVERQPSKLNVVGSSPISRSVVSVGSCTVLGERRPAQAPGTTLSVTPKLAGPRPT
jgi:hypothetical protein